MEHEERTATERIALFPLGTVLFPGMQLPMHLFEPRYLRLMEERLGVDPIFGIVLTKTGREVGDQPEIYEIGTAASLQNGTKLPDGRWAILVTGTRRFRVGARDWSKSYLTADVTWLDDQPRNPDQFEKRIERARSLLTNYVRDVAVASGETSQLDVIHQRIEEALPADPLGVLHAICATLPLANRDLQELLETDPVEERADRVIRTLQREIALLRATGSGGALGAHAFGSFSPN